MARKLSDADVAEIRVLAGDVPAGELAARFGVSARHVGRILRGEQRVQLGGLDRDVASRSVAAAVESLVAGLELDDEGRVFAAAAAAVAEKLDSARASDAAAAAAAVPALARQLVDTVAALRGDVVEPPDALDRLRRRREARLLASANGAGTHDAA